MHNENEIRCLTTPAMNMPPSGLLKIATSKLVSEERSKIRFSSLTRGVTKKRATSKGESGG
jgi:hypothetical protein